MADGDPLSYLFDVLSFKRMAVVSLSPASVSCFAVLLKAASSESQPLVPPLKKQSSLSNYYHSHGRYNIYLGLHPYFQHGGRSGLEIKVEFHEGPVPLSTLPAIYRYHPLSILSVSFSSISLSQMIFALDATGINLTRTACRRLSFSGGKSLIWFHLYEA